MSALHRSASTVDLPTASRTVRGRAVVAMVTFALLSVTTVAPVSAAEAYWAWVVARHPASLSYTPAAIDQGNSLGASNTVVHDAIGRYTVTLGSMGGSGAGGIFQVGVLGAQPRFCAVYNWGPNGPDMQAAIRCHSSDGVPAESKIVVAFQDRNFDEGREAYFLADQPTAPGYIPMAPYNYNSTNGGINSVTRQGVGRYYVQLDGLGSAKGSVQVSVHGDVHACRAQDWFAAATGEVVRVRCRDDMGQPVDSLFMLTFVQGQGLKGPHGTRSAYLWANRPTASSYHPDAHYRWSSAGTTPTVTRSAVGVYSVTLPGMPRGGAALVTATGSGTPRCIVGSIRTDASPQRVTVRCFSVAGAPHDASFTLTYLR